MILNQHLLKLYQYIKLTCFTHISLAFYGNLNQVLPQNLVGRLMTHDRVLGRYTRFYDPGICKHFFLYHKH